MRTMRSMIGLIAAAIPVLYCGGLLLYFSRVRTASGGFLDSGLGPTMLGLGALGLLFLIPLVLRIRRLVAPPAAPGSGGGRRAAQAPPDEGSDFDPDAAIARYLARRPAGAAGGGGPVRQAAFGRRGGLRHVRL